MSTTITAVVMDVAQARFATRLGLVGGTSVLDGAISLVVFAAPIDTPNADRGFGDLVRVQIHRWVLSPFALRAGEPRCNALLLAAGMRVGVTVARGLPHISCPPANGTHHLRFAGTGLFRFERCNATARDGVSGLSAAPPRRRNQITLRVARSATAPGVSPAAGLDRKRMDPSQATRPAVARRNVAMVTIMSTGVVMRAATHGMTVTAVMKRFPHEHGS